MKFEVAVLILAFAAACAPLTAGAQGFSPDFSQGSPGGANPNAMSLPSQENTFGNVNPFTGAAGADRYIQDETTAGFPTPDSPSAPSDTGNSENNLIGGNASGSGNGSGF